jgi:hypothetical protein
MEYDVSAPLWRFTYTMTRADWAAYQALPRELHGWRRWLYFILAAVAGLLWGLIEDVLGIHPPKGWGLPLTILFIVIFVYGLHTLVLSVDRHIKIARYPLPKGETVIEYFGDHFAITADDNAEYVPWEFIGQVVETPDHVFLDSGADKVIIMPLRCFEDAIDMQAFAGFARDIMRDDESRGVNNVEKPS